MCIYVYKIHEAAVNCHFHSSVRKQMIAHLCPVNHEFNESSLPDLGLKCADDDGRSSGIKFKLSGSLIAFARWSLISGHLYRVSSRSVENGRKSG